MKIPTDTSIGSSLLMFICITTWIAGVVLAKGFWMTLFSIILPMVSWYLVIEKLMMHFGVV